MCRHVDVRLTAAEWKAVRRLHGVMVPVVASFLLMLLAGIALMRPPAGDVLTAAASEAARDAERH